MMGAWILIVVALNSSWSNAGSYSSTAHSAPAIAMQEFSDKKACLFARKVMLERAGEMAQHLNAVCVPKGSK
jgi:hypothetical protein